MMMMMLLVVFAFFYVLCGYNHTTRGRGRSAAAAGAVITYGFSEFPRYIDEVRLATGVEVVDQLLTPPHSGAEQRLA